MSKYSKNLSSYSRGALNAYRCKIIRCINGVTQSFWHTGFASCPAKFMAAIRPLYPPPYFSVSDLHILHDDVAIVGGSEICLTDKSLYYE